MHTWQSGDIYGSGVRIHYYRTGGDRPAIVLLHGMGDNGLCWARVAEQLQTHWDVVMLDARGHGLSDAPETGYTAEEQAPDVAAVVQALGLERPVLMGHSMGGATAVATAAQYPSLIRGLILEDPPWGGPPEQLSAEEIQRRQSDWRALILKRKAMPQAELVTPIRRRFPAWDEADVDALAEATRQLSPRIVNSITGAGIAWQDVVRKVACPMYVITAEPALGAIISTERIGEARQICPTLREIHIVGAGHNIRREQFECFIIAVRNCMTEIVTAI
jgi:pimeloyl-ACP methyl ester carboxylesterase